MPRWLRDVEQLANSVPYGEVNFTALRRKNKTQEMKVLLTDTIRYEKDNDKALTDIVTLLKKLEEIKSTSTLQFTVQLKEGIIEIIGYHHVKQTTYSKVGGRGQRQNAVQGQ